MSTLEITNRDKMLIRLSKLQMFWLDSGQQPMAIRVNYLYNLYRDGRIDHDLTWDLYNQYAFNYGAPIESGQVVYFK